MNFIRQKGSARTTREVNLRREPLVKRGIAVIGTIPSGQIIRFVGWVTDGDSVNGNSKWFKAEDNNYFWSGNVEIVSDISQVTPGSGETRWYPPIRPDKFIVFQKFLNYDPYYTITKHHPGVDYSAKGDQSVPLYFCADGEVIESSSNPYFGNYFFFYVPSVDHTFIYFHLRSISPAKGQYKAGEQCGIAGNTGKSEGIHLHLECMKGRKTSADRSKLYTSKDGLVSAAEDADVFIRSRLEG